MTPSEPRDDVVGMEVAGEWPGGCGEWTADTVETRGPKIMEHGVGFRRERWVTAFCGEFFYERTVWNNKTIALRAFSFVRLLGCIPITFSILGSACDEASLITTMPSVHYAWKKSLTSKTVE